MIRKISKVCSHLTAFHCSFAVTMKNFRASPLNFSEKCVVTLCYNSKEKVKSILSANYVLFSSLSIKICDFSLSNIYEDLIEYLIEYSNIR